ncbi:MAG: nucleotide sugar dehydrogenase [Actinomycetia bacterium]|nr:nucleotide sugar dehydrogenase [Actinomycetes bacterium]MCP4222998.1 nucleotide sugar dehydrogenase [Actinomycetes bacterium]MCP5031201.1 nucleotide sugar dehydrogenase [Actinomycetes bacterium]
MELKTSVSEHAVIDVQPTSVLFDQAAELLNRIRTRTAKVAVVGQGYVGLPVAMRAAQQGFPTVGYEVDPRRCQALKDGSSYVEDVPDADLQEALGSTYRATADLGDLVGFDVAVITVPTPLREGAPDLSYVASAGENLARVLRAGALIVLESTTFPGTTEEFLRPILETSGLRAGIDFYLGYSPERIDPGNQTWSFVNTPKIVSGVDVDSMHATSAFYDSLVDQVVEVETVSTAELVKILENTYRHVNIALVNEIAMFARELGVDMWAAIDAASTKPFGFTPFWPGPGVGGHCLPIDPSYLSWRVRQNLGQTFRFVELANDVNEHMPDYVAQRIGSLLNNHKRAVNGTKMLLLGLTYKAGTSDWRESPAMVVAERLAALGADIRLCDPHLPPSAPLSVDAPVVEFSPEELSNADLVVVLVDHPEFEAKLVADHAPLVFDTKAVLRGECFDGELL